MEELHEFSQWYEKIYKEHCDENNIPEEFRKVLNMTKSIEEAQKKEKEDAEALGIPCGNLTKEKQKYEDKKEVTEFPYHNLVKNKPDLWFEILAFFGIDYGFPSD